MSTKQRLITEFRNSIAEKDWPMWAAEVVDEMEADIAKPAAPVAPIAQPLSDDQIDDLMPTNTSMPRSDALRWMARAVERHIKGEVKPS